jgi:formamidopyrimidine-DNA glycosylase
VPELPEVETVRKGLNHVTLNQAILGGEVLLERTIAHPISMSEFLNGVTGTAIAQWHRRGKYLFADLVRSDASQPVSGGWLGVHLRMTGQLLWLDDTTPVEKHCRVRLFLANHRELRFVDQRTFGQIWWIPPDRPLESVMTGLQRLGPEPFDTDFSVDYLVQALRDRQRPIKNALLDQQLVAGVGNIYADEALFLSGIRPTTLCAKLKRSHLQKLHAAVIQVLQDGINSGGSTIRNYRTVEGVNGNYAGQAWVYNRDGEPCRTCGTTIQRLKMAGRSAHFCPTCQH